MQYHAHAPTFVLLQLAPGVNPGTPHLDSCSTAQPWSISCCHHCQITLDSAAVQAARRSGGSWTKLRVEGAPEVSDRSLLAIAAQAPALTSLALAVLPGVSVRGLGALASCSRLTTLELSDLACFGGSADEVRSPCLASVSFVCGSLWISGGHRENLTECAHPAVMQGPTMPGGMSVPRQQLSVNDLLLVARLFQSLSGLKELKLAAPAAVVFAAIRFWCASFSPRQGSCSQRGQCSARDGVREEPQRC